ncbi:MAG TPA: hypothetical protein VGN35_10180 [Jatrophihabitantaceae bacterium]|jgi:hypothetical protein|nr:hypothetical protein [Jatrophihabitantaceae bacterium]
MKALAVAAAAGVVAAMVIPAATAQASPAGNGASVVAQQDGVTVHNICAFEDVWLAASGFAPNRHDVVGSIQVVGYGILFTQTISLSDGAGTADTGTPGPGFIGAKVRVRYQTGSSSHPTNLGSFSGTIVDC